MPPVLSQATTHSLRADDKSQGKTLWWPSEACLAPGCWEQQKSHLLLWGEEEIPSWFNYQCHWEHDNPIWQAGKAPLLPFPVQFHSQPSTEGEQQRRPLPSLCLTYCSTSSRPALSMERVQHGPFSGLLAVCNANLYHFCCSTSSHSSAPFFSCTSAPHHTLLALQLCLSMTMEIVMPHLAFCPFCRHLHRSQFCSHRSHPSLLDPGHMKVEHKVTPTLQCQVLLQRQTSVSRLRTGVLSASSNTHETQRYP